MFEPDLLAREHRGGAPYVRVPDLPAEVPVDRVAHLSHGRAVPDDQGLPQVRLLPLRLQVDPHEPEGAVDGLPYRVEPGPVHRGNREDLPALQPTLDGLQVVRGHEVDLVQDDEPGDVDPVPREDVDEPVRGDVLPDD